MGLKAVDLFCGVGGLTCGVIKSGIEVVAGIDIDKTCEYAYTYNNKAKFINKSVVDISSEEINNLFGTNNVKILMGCAPCQPFSRYQKDKQNRSKHEKWGLLYSFLEHIKNIKPEIVSMENVSELVHEKIFLDFINGLKNMGYNVSYSVVNAADYGVPQRRKRLLLLASLYGEISIIPPTHINNHITVRQAIGRLPAISAGSFDKNDPLHRSSKLSPINLERIKHSVEGGTWRDWPVKLLPNCYKKDSGKSYSSVYGRMKWDDISPTLTTQFNRYGTGRYGHPAQDRALSLREGAIIQSFPEDYEFISPSNPNTDSSIARQIGNAVPVKLGTVIGQSILQHINLIKETNGELYERLQNKDKSENVGVIK